MDEKTKLKNICKPHVYEKYKEIDLNSLASYTIKYLKDNNIFLNFENVAVALFLMFPKKFCMVGYEEYPDTNRINRTVNLQLRPKYQNLAFGDPKKGYALTEKGIMIATKVEDTLEGLSIKKFKIKKDGYSISHRTINPELEVKNKIIDSDLFKKYKKDNNLKIEKVELYEFFKASPYTPSESIKEYFNSLKNLVNKINNEDAKNFLNWLDTKWLHQILRDKK